MVQSFPSSGGILPTGPRKPKILVCQSKRRRSPSRFGAIPSCRSTIVSTTLPHLTRSSLHRCLQRHGARRLPEVEGDKTATKNKFKSYAIGFFHVDIAEPRT